MRTILTTDELAAFCEAARKHPYVTVDTEFLRERTYWAQLCLVQIALPPVGGRDDAGGEAVLIDPVEGDMDLAPLWALMADEGVVKVFHAARQDVEIFWHEGGVIPKPLFDTQVAAMVAGFGEQVGYETLVRRIAKGQVDKASRFTDWSRRPLSDAQKAYALADVTHLRAIYEHLEEELERTGRHGWVDEELAVLTDSETYITRPEEAWQKLRTRGASPKVMAVARELAAFRESHAQEKDIPRSRVFKDDALMEIAATRPRTVDDLGRSRLLLRDARKGPIADGILAAVKRGMEAKAPPGRDDRDDRMQVNPALADLLRVLLKAKSESLGVASKLIATSGDLDRIAAGERDVHALEGWRRQAFGDDALRLCEGRVALAASGEKVRVIEIP